LSSPLELGLMFVCATQYTGPLSPPEPESLLPLDDHGGAEAQLRQAVGGGGGPQGSGQRRRVREGHVASHPLLPRRLRRRRRVGRRRLRRRGAAPRRAVGPARRRVPRSSRAIPRLPAAHLLLLLPRRRQLQSKGQFARSVMGFGVLVFNTTKFHMDPIWAGISDISVANLLRIVSCFIAIEFICTKFPKS
jgi:hypothetical protein